MLEREHLHQPEQIISSTERYVEQLKGGNLPIDHTRLDEGDVADSIELIPSENTHEVVYKDIIEATMKSLSNKIEALGVPSENEQDFINNGFDFEISQMLAAMLVASGKDHLTLRMDKSDSSRVIESNLGWQEATADLLASLDRSGRIVATYDESLDEAVAEIDYTDYAQAA